MLELLLLLTVVVLHSQLKLISIESKDALDWTGLDHLAAENSRQHSVNICILIVAYFELWLLWLFCVNSIYWFLLYTRATTHIEISWLPCCRPIWLFAALAVALGFISIDQRAKNKKEILKIANESFGHSGVISIACWHCCSSLSSWFFSCCCCYCWQLPSAIENR